MDVTLTNRGLLRVALAIFGLFLAYRFLATVASTALLVATGLLLAVALSGPVEALHRRKLPRPAATAIVIVVLLVLLGLGGYLLLPTLAGELSQLASALPASIAQFWQQVQGLAGRLGLQIGGGGGISTSTMTSVARRILGGALGLFGTLTSLFLALFVLVFVPIYLAALPGPAVRWVVGLFPPERRDRTREVLSATRSSLLDWLKGRLASMAIVGGLSIAALYLIGIPGALSLGILTGLVSFVPLVGPVISVVPPALLALAGNPIDALYVIAAYIVIQQIESNLITPLIMDQVASIHPAMVIISVTVLGTAFGLLGTLLAVPIVVVAGVLINELWARRLESRGS